MIEFCDEAISPGEFSARMSDDGAGALAAFEGRVRNHHLGRCVNALEYEAAPVLARSEFAKIVAAVSSELPIIQVLCVHRLGRLEVGEIAIWLGVLAPHRKEAFLACERLMSELKKHLPIWKKEYFADGSVSWVDDPCGCIHT